MQFSNMTFNVMSAALSVLPTRDFSKIFLRARRALEFSHGVGQSRRGRLLPIVGRLPPHPESGRKSRRAELVEKGQLMHCSKPSSFDQLVGCDQKRVRHCEAERHCRFEIDGSLVFRRHLHRKVGWFGATQNAVNIIYGLPKHLDLISSIGNKATGRNEEIEWIDRRQAIPRDAQAQL